MSDEGLGIPPAEQDRIFEKFFRLDPNLTRGVGGTGLGLYICRELVTRMAGPDLGRLRRPHRLDVLRRAAGRLDARSDPGGSRRPVSVVSAIGGLDAAGPAGPSSTVVVRRRPPLQ